MTRVPTYTPTFLARAALAGLCLLAVSSVAEGFDDRFTHPRMTVAACVRSALDAVLRDDLAMRAGIDSALTGVAGTLSIIKWLELGSRLEDDPACRGSNHFHNALRPFADAMVTDLPGPIRDYCVSQGFGRPWSNAVWGTRHTSPQSTGAVTGNPFDWDSARRSYRQALTLPTPSEREAALADTFKTLGHVMHLIQDLAVPAHARNDFVAHLEFFPKRAPFIRWFENGFERFVRRRPELVDAAPTMNVWVAGQPLIRFWDLDLYVGSNPSDGSDQGLGEYTNANFASPSTIFSEGEDASSPYAFPFPRQSSTNLADLVQQAFTVARTSLAEDRLVDTGLYLSKVRDGERMDHFLRAGYLTRDLIDNAPPQLLRLTFQFDDAVHQDYAARLVPRAIGYSRALLDYFFRGRLDVDVIGEVDDPSLVRVRGANASPDALLDGTLKLYGEDPNGVRAEATAREGVTLANVPPAGMVQSSRFELPAGTERVVAVYEGTLGREVGDPSVSAPGGLIGKVLGGVRVEQIFADGGTWRIRTPRGIFTLPLSTDEFEEVKWGDGDDVIVARTSFGDFGGGTTTPNRFVSYRVARRPGSADFAVSGSTPVTLTRLREAVFPLGMPVGTSVHFTQNVQYRQRIARVGQMTQTFTWNGGAYVLTDTDLDSPTPAFETAHSQALSFGEQFPIVLDTFHNSNFLDSFFGATDNRYIWFLDSFTADASGRLLAVIEVRLIRPNASGHAPFFVVDPDTGARVEQGQTFVPGAFPAGINPLLWTVVDVQAQEVVASSAPGVVVITSDTAFEAPPWASVGFPSAPGLYAPTVQIFVGGDAPGSGPLQWNPLGLVPVDPTRSPPASMGDVASAVGSQRIAIGGWPRSELAAALPASYQVVNGAQTRAEMEYFRKPAAEAYSVNLVIDQGRFADHPPRLMEARRVRPIEGVERIVLLAERRGNDDLGVGHIVVWEPHQAQARVAADLPTDSYRLRGASSGAALVTNFSLTPTTRFVPLDGVSPLRAYEGDLSETFAVLDPTYLYNVGDFRFYRHAPLQATALPARLVPATAPGGEFHAIRVP